MKNTVTIDVVQILRDCVIAINALEMPYSGHDYLEQTAFNLAERAIIEAEAAIEALTEKDA
jgi:hypothetical protein